MTAGRSTPFAMLALAALLGVVGDAAAQQAPEFFLDLDTGGHRAFVKDIAFTPDGEALVTASDDKTIRVWDWRTGVTLKTLRGEIGEANDGKVFAVAVSPDGGAVAAGGWFGPGLGENPPYGDIRLFDLSSGRITAVLEGPEYAVYDVAFSPDGNLLAAGGQDGFAYVWKADGAGGWTPDRRLDADSVHIEKLAFALGGRRLAATTADYGIRLWNLDGDEPVEMPDAAVLEDTPVMALAVSPDGTLFATGNSEGLVQVWRAEDGTLANVFADLGFLVGALTFAEGGRSVVASCGYRCTDRNRSIVLPLDGSASRTVAVHDGTVYASATSPDGTLVATAGGTRHEIIVWNPATGETTKAMVGSGEPVTAVGIGEANSDIAWGAVNPCPDQVACPDVLAALQRHLLLPTADRFFEYPEPLPSDPSGYVRSVHKDGRWSLTAAPGGKPVLDNAVLEIREDGVVARTITNDATNGYLHSAFSLLAEGLRLVTGGSDGTLIEYFSSTAEQAGEYRDGHTGEVNAVAISERHNLMLTGSADQTLRLWNLETRELIVSMFFAGGEFVIWMPQGYYYSSDEGDKLIGWHVNQGPAREARFVRAAQLKRYLWSPEMVRRAIVLRSAKAALAEMRPGADRELERLLQRKPPEFDIRVAEDQSGAPDGQVTIEIVGVDPEAAAGKFTVLSNSRNVTGVSTRSISGDGSRQVIHVPVDEGENRIAVTGVNEFGYLTERGVVAIGKRKTGQDARKGKLYVVVIGAEDYPLLPTACNGRSCDLTYPVDDAAGFLSVLAERSAPLHTGMEALVLMNREALEETPDRLDAVARVVPLVDMMEPEADIITDELADFLEKPGPDDTTIVFVAGHGVNVGERYFFVPSDARTQDDGDWRRSSLVNWADIQDAVEQAEGTRLMLLDTCHAANAFNPALEKAAADARIVVFSATAANSTAQERPELGHGVFTYAVLAGMRGEANTSGDGVRLLGLADYIYREVTRLTDKQQKPFYYISNMENILLAQP
ncbi:MAG: caspase family protein [Rhizobiaceae bacterium]